MAIIKRYDSQSTFQSEEGYTFSHRYKRQARNFGFIEITLDKPTTLDELSLLYYETPILFWAIADINNILDPLPTIPAGTTLKIPQLG